PGTPVSLHTLFSFPQLYLFPKPQFAVGGDPDTNLCPSRSLRPLYDFTDCSGIRRPPSCDALTATAKGLGPVDLYRREPHGNHERIANRFPGVNDAGSKDNIVSLLFHGHHL